MTPMLHSLKRIRSAAEPPMTPAPKAHSAAGRGEGLAEAEIIRIMRDELDWPEDKDPDDATGDALARIAKRLAVLRSAGTEGGEIRGAIPEECLCPSGETFTADEVCDHLRAAVDEAGGVDAWAAAARVSRHGAADFLAGGPLTSHRLMNAIGFEPITVYRPITEAGRRALRPRITDGGEA